MIVHERRGQHKLPNIISTKKINLRFKSNSKINL